MSTTINRLTIGFGILFPIDVPLHLICMPYQCLHTHWLRGQPTYMAHNDLCLINIVVLGNNISLGREQI